MNNLADNNLSAWRATAETVNEFSSLNDDLSIDVTIVGGGFTGLSTARDLLERGISCVVIEAKDIAFGASGRSGGFCVPRYKKSFSEISRDYGNDIAIALHSNIISAVDSVDATVSRYKIDCDWFRNGHLTPADTQSSLTNLNDDVSWLRKVALDNNPKVLDRSETASFIGSEFYKGAYFDKRGGCIHPYKYARGLAIALSNKGVPIYTETPAERLLRDNGRWIVETPKGKISSKYVVIATNAYGIDPLFKNYDLHKRVVPVTSSLISTRPLSEKENLSIIPSNLPISDTKKLVNYFRKLPNGQLIFGGRGDSTGKKTDIKSYYPIEKQLAEIFPQLAGIEIKERWSGNVAMHLGSFPHVGEIGEGLFFGMGYGGRGVALTSLMGSRLAAKIAGEDFFPDPMTEGKFKPIPFHKFRGTGVKLMVGYYKVKEKIGM